MKRTVPYRIASALMAAVFLLGGAVELYGSHVCAHHDPIAYAAQAAGDEDSVTYAHHGHDQSAVPGSDHEASGSDHEGYCSCLGACASGAPSGLPAPTVLRVDDELGSVSLEPVAPVSFVYPHFVPFLLPYAHAPPLLG